MTVKQPTRRLGLPLICVLTGCVLLAVAATALYLTPPASPAGYSGSASLQASGVSGLRNASAQSTAARERLVAAYGNLPLAFEANQGQTDVQVKYMARGNGYTLFLTPSEAVLSLPIADEAAPKRSREISPRHLSSKKLSAAVVRMQMVGANPHAQVAGQERLPGVSNYFIGNDPHKWQTGVPQYGRVAYQDVYPGVNLAFHGEQRQMEFDFIVAAGADPAPIGLHFTGAKRVATDDAGNLILSSSGSDVRLHKPVAYQEKDGARQLVDARFVVKDGNHVSFALGEYDRSRELVIDPSVTYATYLGGSLEDDAFAIAAGAGGAAYVTGQTLSSDFPPNPGTTRLGVTGGFDVFVSKLAADGSSIIYSTYIGGSLDDSGNAIAVDGSGNAYVAGGTGSNNFPHTVGVPPPDFAGGALDAFVLRLNSTGSALTYSTFLGGNDDDVANGIAVDNTGAAYVVGTTRSPNFPILNPIQATPGGNSNPFVTKLNSSGVRAYSTYVGGGDGDSAAGVALDTAKNAYVTGATFSSTFPHTAGAFQIACSSCGAGFADAFVTVINAAGSNYVYSTFLGGSAPDQGLGIAVDSAGAAYVTGITSSTTTFPLQSPVQSVFGGGNQDAFVSELNASGTALVYSTFLGGSQDDAGTSIALDGSKNAYVTGQTNSSNFPTANATQGTIGGTTDGFVTEISASGSQRVFSTFLGGSNNENTLGVGPIGGIAVDGTGNIYVDGNTASISDFPTQAAVQATYGGSTDGFVAKFAPTPGFNITVAPGSATVTHGSSTSPFTITVNGTNGFASAVTLSCTGAASSVHIGCVFSPTAPTPGTATTLTITTAAATASLTPSSNRGAGLFYAMWLPVSGLALVGVGSSPRKRKLVGLVLGCVVFAGLLVLPACSSGNGGGGGGGGGTPPGTYNITVVGTGGGITNNGTPVIVLTVN